MKTSIQGNRGEIAELCRRYRVRRLELFGSAVGDHFDPRTSDFDFLVEFEGLTPAEHSRCYTSHGPD